MHSKEHPNTYMIQNRSSGADLERLVLQDTMLTQTMGGVFPEQPEATILQWQQILDVGCGAGKWLQSVALLYPHMKKLVGVDISSKMVAYARSQAEEQQLDQRVFFYVMDTLRMLEFPENTFDLVNLRLGVSFMRMWDWPNLLYEFQRVVRPGGIIRIVDTEIGLYDCNSQTLIDLYTLMRKAFFRAGHCFSENLDGLMLPLSNLLTRHGCKDIDTRTFLLDYTGGSERTRILYQDMEIMFRIIRPFLEKWGTVPPDYEDRYKQALEDIRQPNFRAVGKLDMVCGHKAGAFQSKISVAPPTPVAPAPPERSELTERETQVALLVAQGLKNNDIKAHLHISVSTVHSHLSSIYAKLHFNTRAQITKYVLENHLNDTRET